MVHAVDSQSRISNGRIEGLLVGETGSRPSSIITADDIRADGWPLARARQGREGAPLSRAATTGIEARKVNEPRILATAEVLAVPALSGGADGRVKQADAGPNRSCLS